MFQGEQLRQAMREVAGRQLLARGSRFPVLAVTLILAMASACSRPGEPASEAPGEVHADTPQEAAAVVLRGRILDAEGAPAAATFVGLGQKAQLPLGPDGRFELALPSWRARAPVVYLELRRELPEGAWRKSVLIPSAAAAAGIELRLPASDESEPRLTLLAADPAAQTWVDVDRWQKAAFGEWLEIRDDPEAVTALWCRLAADIEASSDPHRRMLMQAGQFSIGRSDPEAGLDRRETAELALAELGLDNPRWAIWPMALSVAIYETGRWDELAGERHAAIATHVQPEIAAYLALELYMQATAEGRWLDAEAIWAAVEARPELAETFFGPTLASFGPERRLAPGNFLPEVCVEELGFGSLCTDALAGLTVIELWSVGCKGCRESAVRNY